MTGDRVYPRSDDVIILSMFARSTGSMYTIGTANESSETLSDFELGCNIMITTKTM